MKIYLEDELVQGSDQWLKTRLGKFGSTDAQAVAAKGRGLTTLIYKKVAEMMSGKLPEQFKTAAMIRGNETEEEARIVYELQTGRTVKTVGYIEVDEFIGGSPDGLVGEDGLVEIKCPNGNVFVKYLYDKKCDSKYMWQMQHMMFISDRKWCDYIVFHPDFPEPLIVERILRDEEKIEKIKAGLEKGTSEIKKILNKVSI